MKRKIRPAEEEMGNVAFLILFAILWYACLVASIVNGGTRITVLLFFVAGLFPVYSAVTMIRKAQNTPGTESGRHCIWILTMGENSGRNAAGYSLPFGGT